MGSNYHSSKDVSDLTYEKSDIKKVLNDKGSESIYTKFGFANSLVYETITGCDIAEYTITQVDSDTMEDIETITSQSVSNQKFWLLGRSQIETYFADLKTYCTNKITTGQRDSYYLTANTPFHVWPDGQYFLTYLQYSEYSDGTIVCDFLNDNSCSASVRPVFQLEII